MKLEVQQATSADIDSAKQYYTPETGNLCAAAAGAFWPEPEDDTAKAKLRAEWSCQQQKEVLENDPSTEFIKVVDRDKNDELVAFGRWHRYPHGYEHLADLELVGLKDRDDPATWPDGFNKEAYLGVLDPLFAARRSWMGEGHYWGASCCRRIILNMAKRHSSNEYQNPRTTAEARCRLSDLEMGSRAGHARRRSSIP